MTEFPEEKLFGGLDLSILMKDLAEPSHGRPDTSERYRSSFRSTLIGERYRSFDYPDLLPDRDASSYPFEIGSLHDPKYDVVLEAVREALVPLNPPVAATPVVNSEPHGSSQESLGKTSKKYAERMELFEFGRVGNPLLKSVVQQRIEAWERKSRSEVSRLWVLAERMNKSVEAVEELFQQKVEALMEECQFFRATQTEVFLKHIIGGEGRYKSQFETNKSDGTFYPKFRSTKEDLYFGFPKYDTPEGEQAVAYRPIYGYFALDDNGILNESGKHPPANSVSGYGAVTVKINKKIAMERATISFRDSLHMSDVPLVPAALPHYSALCYAVSGKPEIQVLQQFLEEPVNHEIFRKLFFYYTETQFHGGLTARDIESVHLSLANGLDQDEIDEITAAVEVYNQETGGNIAVVIY